MSRRNGAVDFQRDVAAQTGILPGHVWAAVLNADNTSYSIQLNGVTQYKVLYNTAGLGSGSTGAITDANPSGDRVTVLGAEGVGVQGTADAQIFINNLR